MSNTIAHLAVAKEIIEKKPKLVQNVRAYYLGILAPDTITSKPDAVKEDKKRAYLLETRPKLGELFEELRSKKADFGLHGWIEKEYIDDSMCWWTDKYLPGIKERKLLYIETTDIDEFITYSSEKIIAELETDYSFI